MTSKKNDNPSDHAPPIDPFAQLRKLMGDMEGQSNTTLNRLMDSDAFVAMLGRSNSAMLTMQAMMGQWMPRLLAMWHVPSQADIHQLGERLQAIEEQLRRLEDATRRSPMAHERALEQQRANRPAKTRKPPALQLEAPAPAPVVTAPVVASAKPRTPAAPRKTKSATATRQARATRRSGEQP